MTILWIWTCIVYYHQVLRRRETREKVILYKTDNYGTSADFMSLDELPLQYLNKYIDSFFIFLRGFILSVRIVWHECETVIRLQDEIILSNALRGFIVEHDSCKNLQHILYTS
jgi:hypothetical protein